MKILFFSKRFTQVFLGLVALAFTPSGMPAAESQTPGAATNSVAIIGEGASPAFRAVASRLELGGCFYDYSETGGVKILATFLDEILKALPERERKDIPPGFTVAKLFHLLGLDSVAATGSSARTHADGGFHSRTFAYMPDGRKGLMTLSGGPAAKLMLLDFAPKDTDLALEFPIDLKDFAREALPEILAMIPPEGRAQFDREMSQPLRPIGITGRQIIEKLDLRAGIFLRLDPSQKFQPAPGAPPLPGADAVIVIERLGWLVEALKPQFMPMLSQPDSPVSVTYEGGVLTLRMISPVDRPPLDYQPVLRYDSKADRILIATRPAIFGSVVAGGEKITQGADFAQTWRDLPDEGNACIYASPRLLRTAADLIEIAAKSDRSSSPADKVIIGKIFNWVKALLNRGQAVVIANQPDGILTLANASVPIASSSMTAVSTVAVMAGFALPVFSRAQVRAVETNDLSTLRQVQIGLRMYAADNKGIYPTALSDIMPKYVNDKRILEFSDRRTGRHIPWLYRNSLTEISPADELLVAAPVATAEGKRAVGFNDGSARYITEAEFQTLWNRK